MTDSHQVPQRNNGDDIETRAKRANLEDFDRIMAKVPNVPPMPGDELPEGYEAIRPKPGQ